MFGASRFVVITIRSPANSAHDSLTPSAMTVRNGASEARSFRWIAVGPDDPSITCTSSHRPSSESTDTGIWYRS